MDAILIILHIRCSFSTANFHHSNTSVKHVTMNTGFRCSRRAQVDTRDTSRHTHTVNPRRESVFLILALTRYLIHRPENQDHYLFLILPFPPVSQSCSYLSILIIGDCFLFLMLLLLAFFLPWQRIQQQNRQKRNRSKERERESSGWPQ